MPFRVTTGLFVRGEMVVIVSTDILAYFTGSERTVKCQSGM